MHRRTAALRMRSPKNEHIAPHYDSWFEKHDAWKSLKRMAALAGTGYYIPPAWYQHFRMFPPAQHNFEEELTQNPENSADPTMLERGQLNQDYERRSAVRLELAKRSRSAAATGNRYLNQFWVRKPIDDMERDYYRATGDLGMSHDEALRYAVKRYREKQAVRVRAQRVQSEEARLTGKFVTMREALSVMQVLHTVHESQLTTQQVELLAGGIRRQMTEDAQVETKVTRRTVPKTQPAPIAAKEGDGSTDGVEAKDGKDEMEAKAAATSKEATQDEGKVAVGTQDRTGDLDDLQDVEELLTSPTEGDSLPKLRNTARDGLSDADVEAGMVWYGGFSPEVESAQSTTSKPAASTPSGTTPPSSKP